MVPDEPSIRQVGPGFTISPGTQVVLKVRKALATGEEYRKAGSVGIVVESPPAEGQPYVVHFADGSTVEDSDDDLRGIYLPPARLHWSLYRLPEQPDRRSVNELLIELRVGPKGRSLGLT